MTRQEQIEKAAHDYINSDAVPAWNEQLAFGDFINGCHWADEHPNLYSVTRKAVEREREYLINKACEWLRRTQPQVIFPDTTIERFKKAMEERQ